MGMVIWDPFPSSPEPSCAQPTPNFLGPLAHLELSELSCLPSHNPQQWLK